MTILMALAMAEAAGSVTMNVSNVRNARGKVVVELCTQSTFLADSCALRAEAPARAGATTVTIPNVPAGHYAVQAFHDENGNGDVDRAMFGIPREGVGFSRNARITLSPPKWRDAVFVHPARPETISFSLRYFMGAKGPTPLRK
jgi:uncharacterized protein (DUF2141 family)